MKRINGVTIIERDHVGEVGYVNAGLVRSACNAFFARRGMPTGENFRVLAAREAEVRKARRRRRSQRQRLQKEAA